MDNSRRFQCAAAFAVLVPATAVYASHQETGGVTNSDKQIQICAAFNDFLPETFSLTFYGPDGAVLVTQNFVDVPSNGIASLTYMGNASVVSCESSPSNETALNILDWDFDDDEGPRVTAIQGNHNSGDEDPVVNMNTQTPVCTGNCNEDGPCDFELIWWDAGGNNVASQTFQDVPLYGSRSLAYHGSASLLWCERDEIEGDTHSNFVLVHRANGRVEAGHQGRDGGNEDGAAETGAVPKAFGQDLVCLAKCQTGGGTCTGDLTWYGQEGQVLASQNFANVPGRGIRSLTYDGMESLVSCRATNDVDFDVSLNVVHARTGAVEALIGGQNGSDEKAVVNSRRQTPICNGTCDGSSNCTFDLVWYDSGGNTLLSQTFTNTPGQGTRQLPYTGTESPVWCDDVGASETNVELVDRRTGRVNASHTNN